MSDDAADSSISHVDRRSVLHGVGAAGFGTALGVGTTGGAVRAATTDDEDTQENATEIEDWNDLNAIRNDLYGDYVLVTDLDEETAGYDEHVGDPEDGWEPIGDGGICPGLEFTGTFDGNGHEIADLEIKRSAANCVGFFGGNGGTVKNVIITDAEIAGNKRVGGLVGSNGSSGEVAESSVSIAEITDGNEEVGGLVGGNYGKVTESSVNDVQITGNRHVGGLVGYNPSEVGESSVSDVQITGNRNVGGLVGWNHNGEVAESWVAGDVTGEENIGGFVGSHEDDLVTAGYWDTESSGQSEGIGSGDGDVTGLTAAEMQGKTARDAMEGLDFEETWAVQTAPDDYPVLQWQDDGTTDGAGDGLPGFGVVGTFAGIGGGTYVLKRCLRNTEPDST
ncbi:hypothetical protein [Halopiger djelfimassiliensis]|uniref:hypothetical protein n=1 Tax=Halopiger djelfimassiliensis TaxID=1293047 RepID=UPI0012B60A55|nr:hypothetical protein [Halopiger djelfimassiliensis]